MLTTFHIKDCDTSIRIIGIFRHINQNEKNWIQNIQELLQQVGVGCLINLRYFEIHLSFLQIAF
jgi:hypothetical protein